MTINEMKELKSKFEEDLIKAKSMGNGSLIRKIQSQLKDKIEKIDMMIFKAESTEQFYNYKDAIKTYVANTHYFS